MLFCITFLVNLSFAFKLNKNVNFRYNKLFDNKNDNKLVFSDFIALYENLTKEQLDQLSVKPTKFEHDVYEASDKKYINDLFNRLPIIPPTELTAVRSKATVKGRVGTRAKLVRGDGTLSLDPGVYNGLHPIKHTKKRIIRELKVKLDWYSKSICKPLKDVYDFYTHLPKYINPLQYYQIKTSLHFLYSSGKVKSSFANVLEQISQIKAQIIRKTSEFCIELDNFKKCRDAFMYVKGCVNELDTIMNDNEEYIKLYQSYRSFLRKIPRIELNQSTIAIIGHVNVGKSTLFKKILKEYNKHKIESTGFEACDESTMSIVKDLGLSLDNLGQKEEVSKKSGFPLSNQKLIAPYNFTTKTILPSQYLFSDGNNIHNCQLLDTPGLLPRDSGFNPYEKLTYSLLREFHTGVVFAVDTLDTDLDSQKKIYDTLRNRYDDRPWITVVAKGHMLEEGEKYFDNVVDFTKIQPSLNKMHAALTHQAGILPAPCYLD